VWERVGMIPPLHLDALDAKLQSRSTFKLTVSCVDLAVRLQAIIQPAL
jgi:hypothetical protein